MRLIATYHDEKRGAQLSHYLSVQGIENEMTLSSESNWGDPNYGTTLCRVWVIEEENFQKAIEIANNLPKDIEALPSVPPKIPAVLSPEEAETAEIFTPKLRTSKSQSNWNQTPLKGITLNLLVCCCLLLFFTTLSAPQGPKVPNPALPLPSLYFSKLQKEFLFDYPHAYEIVDDLVNKVGLQNLETGNPLPQDALPLLSQYEKTPYWKGFYDQFVSIFRNVQSRLSIDAPMFEKIRQGEWWRLLTPSVLHADLFHLLFNMIWLVILGKQMEIRLGGPRYLLFLILAALVTNLGQYLMSGSNFLGFSGIVCAMIAFIWTRQRKAPWEGYLMQRTTFNFVIFFLFLITALQFTSFYSEIVYGRAVAPPIANTAHLTGLIFGFILGNLNFFAWKYR